MFNFIFKLPHIAFMQKKFIFLAISGFFIFISLSSLAVSGLNLGIDFIGGIVIEVETRSDITILRQKVATLSLGDVNLQSFGADNIILIRVERQAGGEKAQQAVIKLLKEALASDVIEFRRVEAVGPTIGAELRKQAFIAITLALLAIMAYIWLRFEWQFGLGAILALVHDLIITTGLYSLAGIEFNLSMVAALLTIAGYSINDTVVIYDRLRENIRKYRKKDLEEIIDLSLNQVFSRTLITSITTLLALLALVFFGGSIIRNFAIGMVCGVIVGTWSSIVIATALLTKLRPDAEHIG